jgi:adenylate kinase family enzyme
LNFDNQNNLLQTYHTGAFIMSIVPSVTAFSTSQGGIPNFQVKPTQSCVFFCEAQDELLLMPDHRMPWDLPGDNFDGQCTQDVALQIFNRKAQLSCRPTDLVNKGICYLRNDGVDRIIHLFRVTLVSKPASLSDCTWVPLFAFQVLDRENRILSLDKNVLKEGRLDTFNMAFSDRVWHRVQDADNVSKIILQKGGQRLSFDLDHRLVITILGKPLSGKYTQAELLARSLGLKIILSDSQARTLSLDDICREEAESRDEGATPLQAMMNHHDEHANNQPYPCQLTTGLFTHGICKLADLRSVVLRGYPSNLAQCDFFLKIFLRSTDPCFALSLEPSDEAIRAHPKFSEEDSGPRNESRLTEFNQNQSEIKTELAKKHHQVQVLQLSGVVPSVVFHHISVRFQSWLDGLAVAQQASVAIPQPPKTQLVATSAKTQVPTASASILSARTVVVFAGALVIGFVAGSIFMRRQ